MTNMTDKILQIVKPFTDRVPIVLGAIVVFIIGWLISKLLEKALRALLSKIGLDKWLNRKPEDSPVKIEPVISKLAYYLLLVFTLLVTLDLLNVRNVLNPVSEMFGKFVDMIPNIVAAGFIAFAGYVLAKIVSSIVLAASASLDSVAPKAGLGKTTSISKMLSQLIFIIIFIPIMVSSLDTLKIAAIADPAKALLTTLLDSVPYIIGAAVILAVSYIVGRLITGFLTEFLHNLGADEIPSRVGVKSVFGTISFSKFCGGLAFFFIMLAASMAAVDQLKIDSLSEILNTLLQFSGKVVLGLIILGIGNIIANFAHVKLSEATNGVLLPLVARFSILFIVLAMGLHTMGVAKHIIEMTFMFSLGTLSLTIILAFGLGGRETAGKLAAKWSDKLLKK
ncbi:MAG: mechanosensitive ion channel [Kiritimatiellaeota bacterium]|nr:mechanosensitive ion channel [Kiritimatiellota bacterium]